MVVDGFRPVRRARSNEAFPRRPTKPSRFPHWYDARVQRRGNKLHSADIGPIRIFKPRGHGGWAVGPSGAAVRPQVFIIKYSR